MFRLREKRTADIILKRLKEMNLNIKLMHVCGTHQDTLIRFGLDPLFKKVGVEIRQGPGCPVCVTTPKEIEEIMLLAKKGKIITVFGDMVNVPGEEHSLQDIRSQGYDVKIVYSIEDAVNIAKNKKKEVVFMGIGFETTIPSTASTLLNSPPENFSVLSCHRLIPPALKAILEMGEIHLDGLIEPGHVSTIIGTEPYRFLSDEYNIPQVITGFEPLDLLMGVYMLARQIESKESKVENEYTRLVKKEGNKRAVEMMKEVFEEHDVGWRGFPIIPNSGLKLKSKFEEHDARKKFADDLLDLKGKEFKEPEGCRCGEVLRGIISSDECPLFGITCTPQNPIGPCMVSSEGSCNIMLKYRK